MIDFFFKRKSIKKKPPEHPALQYNEIIIIDHDTISLKSMVLSAKRHGNFYIGQQVTVEADGYITGTITAVDGVIKGRVKGNITCSNELVIASTAIIEGAVVGKKIAIERGSIINGSLTVTADINPTVLMEKLRIAKTQLGSGHIPEIETITPPEVGPPVGTILPPSEAKGTPTKQRSREERKTKTKRVEAQPPPTNEEAGNWW